MGRRPRRTLRRRPTALVSAIAFGLLVGIDAHAGAGGTEEFRLLDLSAAGASAEAPGAGRRALAIVPTLAIASTLTDNRRLAATDRQSDWIATVSPGLRLTSGGGPVRGHLDYALDAYVFARDRQSNTVQNALDADLSVEAVENLAYLDLAGTVGQRSVSAFGAQSPAGSLSAANGNSREVATYRLSPYLRGRAGDLAEFEARLTHEATRVRSAAASDSRTDSGLLRLAQGRAYGRLGWGLEGRYERVDFQAGRATTDLRARAMLTWFALHELRLAASLGREANDYAGGERQRGNTAGLGLVWKPGERTQLVAERESRLIGAAHTLTFEHRMRRTVWRLSDTRDASSGFGQRRIGSAGNTYDLLYAQFASREPDPVLRAQLVRDALQTGGLNADSGLPGGALPAALTDERQQSFSFAWLGQRDTLAFNASRNSAIRLDSASSAIDDFAAGVRQQGLSAELSHRLNERSALNLGAAQLQTRGNGAGPASRLRTLNLVWTGRLAPRLGFALGLRHAGFASDTAPYTESALTAGLTLGF